MLLPLLPFFRSIDWSLGLCSLVFNQRCCLWFFLHINAMTTLTEISVFFLSYSHALSRMIFNFEEFMFSKKRPEWSDVCLLQLTLWFPPICNGIHLHIIMFNHMKNKLFLNLIFILMVRCFFKCHCIVMHEWPWPKQARIYYTRQIVQFWYFQK